MAWQLSIAFGVDDHPRHGVRGVPIPAAGGRPARTGRSGTRSAYQIDEARGALPGHNNPPRPDTTRWEGASSAIHRQATAQNEDAMHCRSPSCRNRALWLSTVLGASLRIFADSCTVQPRLERRTTSFSRGASSEAMGMIRERPVPSSVSNERRNDVRITSEYHPRQAWSGLNYGSSGIRVGCEVHQEHRHLFSVARSP